MDQITDFLSTYSCNLTYEDLDREVVHHIKRTIIDTLGCAVGGYLSEPGKIARHIANNVTSTLPSRILGTENYSSIDMAGFANGVMVRYLDCNDSYFSPGGGHPSDMIPAALAMGDPFNADGRTIITATALAYEVFCRISDQVPDSPWDQGIFSVIGAACAAGKVMGLDKNYMANAISLAVVPNVPLRVTRMGELSMWKGCASASATRSGLFAAQLASEGMTGPFEPFEGRKGLWDSALNREISLDEFGGSKQPFRIMSNTFKFYPSQIHTQAPIGLAAELHKQLDVADIKSIHIDSYHGAVSSASTEPEKWDPKTRETADHSIPYLVAVGLQDGMVSPASFTNERIQDPSLRTIINKMTIDENSDFTAKYPDEYNCKIEVQTLSGKTFTAETSFPKGHKNNPLSDSEINDKFKRLATPTITDEHCDMALGLLWDLESLESFDEIFDALVV